MLLNPVPLTDDISGPYTAHLPIISPRSSTCAKALSSVPEESTASFRNYSHAAEWMTTETRYIMEIRRKETPVEYPNPFAYKEPLGTGDLYFWTWSWVLKTKDCPQRYECGMYFKDTGDTQKLYPLNSHPSKGHSC